jgi:hypothetical protein
MKVYMVIGGYNHQGCNQDSLRAFLDKDQAELYAQSLVDRTQMRYDYYELVEQDLA